MENYYLIIIVLLFAFAFLDLIVGVSNDAVNFLNSAIGSRVAPIKVIIFVATLGIIAGSMFSGGIMEVARKGIFNPQMIPFEMIMMLFLAVMITDIILLDLFNTIGFPTSTTVSIVFELLGAATMVGLLLCLKRNVSIECISNYINTKQALTIILGIFLSIIVSFILGSIVQYLSRWIFTFDYEKYIKRYGALFSSIAISAITYFLLIKGLKGSPLSNWEFYNLWIKKNPFITLLALFVFWALFIAILMKFVKANPLRIVVLFGTFSLAMAFAGNDLVNFIGVPLAGFASYESWIEAGRDNLMLMNSLNQPVKVKWNVILLAGLVMAVTLWISSKARRVTETEVNLARQKEGIENFKPNQLSRYIVKFFIYISDKIVSILPSTFRRSMLKNFKDVAILKQPPPAFDLLRASINLMMASIIIAYATSYKMPLSTTYVSFMVAMGTSLADKAWGQESAVYRVAGVLSVIGGWLMTALIAFTVSALFAFILIKLGMVGIIILTSIAVGFLVLNFIRFKIKKAKEESIYESEENIENIELLLENCQKQSVKSLQEIAKIYKHCLEGFLDNSSKSLKKSNERMAELFDLEKRRITKAIKYIKKLDDSNLKVGKLYLYNSDLLQDILYSCKFITDECFYYVRNLHKIPGKHFIEVADILKNDIPKFIEVIASSIKNLEFSNYDAIIQKRKELREHINSKLERQLELIQIEGMNTKQGVVQTQILLQTRDLIAVALRIYKLYSKFFEVSKGY